MTTGFFVTGTDTGVGKTLAACALLHAFASRGKRVTGMKPVAAGSENGRWDDVERLIGSSTVVPSRDLVNPYAFAPAIAPHIAASLAGTVIDLDLIARSYRALAQGVDIVVVEGCGGFLVPLNARETGGELAQRLALPVILVVGLRLGCLNHALLTLHAIEAAGVRAAGWIANSIDPTMRRQGENIAALRARLTCPLIGTIPFRAAPDAVAIAAHLDVSLLPENAP